MCSEHLGRKCRTAEAIKQQEKQQRSRELEQAEKAAFRAAAGQIICHLSER